MLNMLAEATGILFLFAVAAEFIVVFVEQIGAARKQDSEAKEGGLPALALMIVTTLTPALLLLHGYFSTAASYRQALPAAVAAPVLAVIVGAILGRIVGTASQGAARVLRGVALPAAVAAFVLTIYATWPSIRTLIELFT